MSDARVRCAPRRRLPDGLVEFDPAGDRTAEAGDPDEGRRIQADPGIGRDTGGEPMTPRNSFISALVGVILASAGMFLLVLRRVSEIQSRVDAVHEEIQPIHTRCEELTVELAAANAEISATQEEYDGQREVIATQSDVLSREVERGRENRRLVDELQESARITDSRRQAEFGETLRRLQEFEGGLASLADQLSDIESVPPGLPGGVILPWLPGAGGLPAGWLICDGSRGTPDLRDRFLRGAGTPALAGSYLDAAKMQVAGVHSHATDPHKGLENIPVTTPPGNVADGEGRALSDLGVRRSEGDSGARHGAHVHEDQHVPAHFTVVFIMKAQE